MREESLKKGLAKEELSKEELIDQLILLEWKAFDKVENEGGRADCQNNFLTFQVMRRSQYLTWNEELLTSFIQDFLEANERGWNLITEKYGRMMESTAPEEFEKIQGQFPVISPEKKAIIEAIVEIQVKWDEEFAKAYPHLSSQGRSIHTREDNLYNTSSETYLRGELSTYSDRTLGLYGAFVADYARRGENLIQDTVRNTVVLYGYASLEAAEKALEKQEGK
ncbi:MAG: DUF4125 family protein [Roseburia sp.]|nr:DUF4125 family protein [Roseburia sp.]MCM1279415.1 DUF4125 family protein [Robinsoniella sp.]